MKNFFDKIRWGLARFFQGRYGTDELNNVLLISGLVMTFLAYIDGLEFFSLIAYIVLFYALIRSFSRNYDKRGKELGAYLKLKGGIANWFSLQKRKFSERKTHRYFRCKQCRTVMRVPRGKGTIAITCPRCQTKVTHKT